MKFSIPAQTDAANAEVLYESIRRFNADQMGARLSARRIYSVAGTHNGKRFTATVGKAFESLGELVIANQWAFNPRAALRMLVLFSGQACHHCQRESRFGSCAKHFLRQCLRRNNNMGMRNAQVLNFRLVPTILLLLFLMPPVAFSRTDGNVWYTRFGKPRPFEDLTEILRQHRLWVESKGKVGKKADLRGAKLTSIGLRGTYMAEVDLREATIIGSDFTRVTLRGANLAGAEVRGTLLDYADLSFANLSGARLEDVWLTNTDLWHADFSGADLNGVFLEQSKVIETNLSGVTSYWLNLSGTYFEPKTIPEVRGIATSRTLHLVTYRTNPDSLVQLRQEFKNRGFRRQERQITYAIKSTQARLDRERAARLLRDCSFPRWSDPDQSTRMTRVFFLLLTSCDLLEISSTYVSYCFQLVFFDLTCQYGMSPTRPLRILIGVWFTCTLLYMLFIHYRGESGLYRVSSNDPPTATLTSPMTRIRPDMIGKGTWLQSSVRILRREFHVFRIAMFFSLQCSFALGYRELQVGSWLRMLMLRDSRIIPTGWARSLAGFQSLICVYLLSLWLLTNFGRPFE